MSKHLSPGGFFSEHSGGKNAPISANNCQRSRAAAEAAAGVLSFTVIQQNAQLPSIRPNALADNGGKGRSSLTAQRSFLVRVTIREEGKTAPPRSAVRSAAGSSIQLPCVTGRCHDTCFSQGLSAAALSFSGALFSVSLEKRLQGTCKNWVFPI